MTTDEKLDAIIERLDKIVKLLASPPTPEHTFTLIPSTPSLPRTIKADYGPSKKEYP
jgi:hypothetical protein